MARMAELGLPLDAAKLTMAVLRKAADELPIREPLWRRSGAKRQESMAYEGGEEGCGSVTGHGGDQSGGAVRHMLNLKVGDWVEVRSKEEILRTLDEQRATRRNAVHARDVRVLRQRFQVYKRAHKTCDTVFPIRGRRVDDTVHLETRCDGQAHGGCQAGCLTLLERGVAKTG